MKMNISMINQVPAIGELNAVEGFNPADYLNWSIAGATQGLAALDVEYQKLWFRLKYPLGKITKSIVQLTEQLAILEARIYVNKEDGPDNYIANAFAQINSDADNSGVNHLKIAETSAIEQALADAGFGVQFCCVTDDGNSKMDNSVVQTDQSTGQSQTVSGEQPNDPAPQKQQSADPNPQGQPANAKNTKQQPAQQKQPATEKQTSAPAQQEPLKQQYDASTPVEEIVKMMTLEDAKNIIVPLGFHKGKSLGQLAIEKPSAIEWYIKSYTGNHNTLRAGATVLINAAMEQAS